MLFKRIGFVLAAIVLSSASSPAQVPRCPNTGASIAKPCELDHWPLPETRRSTALYPDIFRHAGVEGEVLLRYVVDTTGRTSAATLEVVRSSHELFTSAVRNALLRQRFEAPRRNGEPTSVMMEELVTFKHPAPGWQSDREPVVTRAADSTGRLLTRIYAFLPRDSVNAPLVTRADSLEIHGVLVDELLHMKVLYDNPAAWCVSLHNQPPPAVLLRRWRTGGRRVVATADCPHTYSTMVRTPGDPVRPKGWIDPVHVTVNTLLGWAADRVLLTGFLDQGTIGHGYRCEVVREAGRWTQAFCTQTLARIS